MKKLAILMLCILLINISFASFCDNLAGICGDLNFDNTVDIEDFFVLLDLVENNYWEACIDFFEDEHNILDGRDLAAWSGLNLCPKSYINTETPEELPLRFTIDGLVIGPYLMIITQRVFYQDGLWQYGEIGALSKIPASSIEINDFFQAVIVDGFMITDFLTTFDGKTFIIGFYFDELTGWLGEIKGCEIIWFQLPFDVPLTIQDNLPLLFEQWLEDANFVDYSKLTKN